MVNYDRGWGGGAPSLISLPIEGTPPLSDSLHTILYILFFTLLLVFAIVFVIVLILYSIVLNFYKYCILFV